MKDKVEPDSGNNELSVNKPITPNIDNLEPQQLSKINQAIGKLQRYFYKKRSYKQVERMTGINIEQQSLTNLLNLYKRLKTGNYLPAAVQKKINAEKRQVTDILTPTEWQFYKALINTPFIANHATYSAETIKRSGCIYSTNQLTQRKLLNNTHTADAHGLRHFTFFSVSLPEEINIVSFLGQSDVFTVNLDNYKKEDPASHSGIWSSSHFYAYDIEEKTAPIEFRTTDGRTQVYIRYEISFEPQITYKRIFTFKHPDGEAQQAFTREEEISAHRHIKPYFTLRLIEYLRYFAAEVRQTILQNANNNKLMAKLFNALFTPGKIELHIPELLRIGPQIDTFQFLPWKSQQTLSTSILCDIICANNLPALKDYFNKGFPLKFTRLNDLSKEDLSLLNFAVLKQQYEIISFLMQQNIDPNHEYTNKAQSFSHSATRTALQDAVEMNDPCIIKLLCEGDHQSDLFSSQFFAVVDDKILYTAIAGKLRIDLIDYLLTHYLNFNQNLDHLLLVAVFYDYHEAINLLLQKGANPDNFCQIKHNADNRHLIPLSFQGTSLTIAAKYARRSCVQLLLKNKANPNAYIKEDGTLCRFGRGNTALLVCIETLRLKPSHAYKIGKIENCRYEKNPNYPLNEYIEVIKILLHAGADPYYISGDGESFPLSLKHYLEKEPNATLQKIAEELSSNCRINSDLLQKSDDFHHASYAVITGFNDAQQPVLLLAKRMRPVENEEECDQHWSLPGGKANYLFDANLTQTLIHQTAMQTGLALSDADVKQNVQHYSNRLAKQTDDEILALSHVNLSQPVSQYKFYKASLDLNAVLSKKMDSIIIPLKDIQFIEIKKIEIHSVNYRGISFPLCTHGGIPLPYIACVKVAELCGRTEFNTFETHSLAAQLHFNIWDIFKQAVMEKDLSTIQLLMQLKIVKFKNISQFLLDGLNMANEPLVLYLLGEGIRLSKNQFNLLLNPYETYQYSEDMLLVLCNSHQKIFDNPTLENLAACVGRKGFAKLIDFLYTNNDKKPGSVNNCSTTRTTATCPDSSAVSMDPADKPRDLGLSVKCQQTLIKICGEFAFKSVNYPSLSSLFAKISPQDQASIALQVLPLIPHDVEIKDTQQLINCTYLLLKFCSTALPVAVVAQFSQLYAKIVKENPNPSLQEACLSLIKFMLENNYYDVNIDNIYSEYVWLKETAKKEAEEYLKVILQAPILAIRHASFENLPHQLDQLLALHANNSLVREILRQYTYLFNLDKKDENGDTCLERAIKANAFAVVELLLENCSNNLELAKNGTALITLAIKAGHITIAKLLIKHGAVPEKEEELTLQEKKIMGDYNTQGLFKCSSINETQKQISLTPYSGK